MRERLYEVIFGTDTPAGKAFDVILIWSILISVACVTLESVRAIRDAYGGILYGIEWFFTILFTIEYVLRLVSVQTAGGLCHQFFRHGGSAGHFAHLPEHLCSR